MVKFLIRSLSLRYSFVSISAVIIGAAAAAYLGAFDLLRFLACLLFAIIAQSAANVLHRYFDLKYGYHDSEEAHRIDTSLWEIQPVPLLREAYIALTGMAAMIGLALIASSSLWLILVGVLIVLLTYLNNAPGTALHRRGWGDALTFFAFGPLTVVATCYVIVDPTFDRNLLPQRNLLFPLCLSVISGLMAMSIYLLHNYRQADNDRRSGKQTLATKRSAAFNLAFYALCGLLVPVSAGLLTWRTQVDAMPGHIDNITLIVPVLAFVIQSANTVYLATSHGREAADRAVKVSVANYLLFAIGCFISFQWFSGLFNVSDLHYV